VDAANAGVDATPPACVHNRPQARAFLKLDEDGVGNASRF
jgi:hypothetical protein